MSIEIDQTPGAVQDLRGASHDMRQQVASGPAPEAALTEPDLPVAVRGRFETDRRTGRMAGRHDPCGRIPNGAGRGLSALAKTVVKRGTARGNCIAGQT